MFSVVVVDDEDFITSSVQKFISRSLPDYQVSATFTDAGEALTYLETNPVDVIITDIQMPNINGLELIRRIRQFQPEISILVISGYSEFEYAQQACAYHVRDYLLKPIDWQRLSQDLTEIASLLKKLRPVTNQDDQSVQQFFIDLLCRNITDAQEFDRRYQELPLALLSPSFSGCLLSVSVTEDTRSSYPISLDLPNTILAEIRSSLPQYQCFYLFRNQLRLGFVILSSTELSTVPVLSLSTPLEEALGLRYEVKISTIFHGIKSLLSQPEIATPVIKETMEDDLVIQHAKNFIQTHYADNLSREDVAKEVYLDSSYFSRLFKRRTGMNFIVYLTQVRMEKAKELLATQMNISDISDAVGYQHRNTFISNFKEYTGLTPNEYRKKYLMGDVPDEK